METITWEFANDIHKRFPSFPLKDKEAKGKGVVAK